MADTTKTENKVTAVDDKSSVTLKDQVPSDFKPVFQEIVDKSENLDRRIDKGIVNNKTGSSVAIRDDGQINLSASLTGQYKVSPNGKAEEISLESMTKTNRKSFLVDDFVINNHKMNPQLWEMTDYRQLFGDSKFAAGGLTLFGTVLVKAWEPNLKRYVLIRRLARMPAFGREMNTAKINDALNIKDSTVVQNTYDSAASESTVKDSTTAESGSKAVSAAVSANSSAGSGTTTDKKNTTTSAETEKSSTEGKTADAATTTTGSTADTANKDKIETAAGDVLAKVKTMTPTTGKIDASTIDDLTKMGAALTGLTKSYASINTNKVTDEISEISKLLSKDISIGTAAVNTQLIQTKKELIAQALKEAGTGDLDKQRQTAQMVLTAADKVFDDNKLSLLKAASQIQSKSEAYIKSQVSTTVKNSVTKDLNSNALYKDLYANVKSIVGGNSSLNSLLNGSKDTVLKDVMSNAEIKNIVSTVQETIKKETEKVMKASIVENVLKEIEKEKAAIKEVEAKIAAFEQQEIAKIAAAAQMEVNSFVSSTLSAAASSLTKGISDTISNFKF